MDSRTLEEDYGGPYADARPMLNPNTDQGAEFADRALEDTAQLTRTSRKLRVTFATTASGAPTVAGFSSQWGDDPTKYPTLTRDGVGLVSVAVPATYADALGVIENVVIGDAWCVARSSSGDVADQVRAEVVSITGTTVAIKIESPPGVLADVGDNSGDPITVSVYVEP